MKTIRCDLGKTACNPPANEACTMNILAPPIFTPSRRSLLNAGVTIGITLALHNAAFAETKGATLPIKETDIPTNGINLHVTELGEGPAILFVHGFPDTAYTWRKQMQAVAAAGFRAIAPDMRGYGGSSALHAVSDRRRPCRLARRPQDRAGYRCGS